MGLILIRLCVVVLMVVEVVVVLMAEDCPSTCGDIKIPYPFGTRPGCYLSDEFLITCNHTFSPSKPFLRESALEVTNIDLENGLLQIQTFVSSDCPKKPTNKPKLSIRKSTTTISSSRNKFTVIGCNSYGYINGTIGDKHYAEGCVSNCDSLNSDEVVEGDCSGAGCCQIDIPKGLQYYRVEAYTFPNERHTDGLETDNPCSYAFVIDNDQFYFSKRNLTEMPAKVPAALDWAITGNGSCNGINLCNEPAVCNNANISLGGYNCKCPVGYRGNPYVLCQDINECEEGNYTCPRNAYCVNLPGSHTCRCRGGHHGSDCRPLTQILLGVSFGFVIFLLSSFWAYSLFRKRRLNNLREKFFQQNGGYLLQQQLSKRNGSSDHTAKIFTQEELDKATDNFHDDRIIGRGGYGTVYKGILSDNTTVAIKKSKVIDKSQLEQFINEVTVLSRINHRNIVKLLGCCLETEVPLLVYEYISNGTLFEHIHNKMGATIISWDTRLRIAAETAGVLSYLHSSASTPVIHRDVKSANILLDDNFTAKVSDFGTSKLVPMDEMDVSTMVQGTLGYLDPEYLHTSQLTEKSDVYSFGVVLVELMTGKKVVSFDRPEEERSLVMHFLVFLREGRLFEIVEKSIVKDENAEQMREVAELARSCLQMKGEERPSMKEVAMELEGLRMKKHLWDNVEVNIEETQHLLCKKSLASSDADANNSTTGYDSIKNHVLRSFEINGGR